MLIQFLLLVFRISARFVAEALAHKQYLKNSYSRTFHVEWQHFYFIFIKKNKKIKN